VLVLGVGLGGVGVLTAEVRGVRREMAVVMVWREEESFMVMAGLLSWVVGVGAEC